MVRSAKRSGKKRRAKISFNDNSRKNKWKREKKARQHVACPQVQEAWDPKQNAKTNMEKIGLAYNINKLMKPPSTKEELKKLSKRNSKDVIMVDADSSSKTKRSSEPKDIDEVPAKSQVVEDLEAEAAMLTEEAKKGGKKLRLSQPEIRYCIYMIEKYGDNYDRMARDQKNVYQETAAQIRRKLETFKSIPIQYNAYLRSKGLLTENGAAPMEMN